MALLLALVVWAVMALMVGFMVSYGLPQAFSTVAPAIDAQFNLTLAITGVAFVLAQLILGWFIFRYRDRGEGPVKYSHGHTTFELGAMAVTGLVFVALGIKAQTIWAKVHLTEDQPDSVIVEVVGQQFAWNIRYPGPDGKFGRWAPEFYDDETNPIGIDPGDPAGEDDIVTINNVAIPVDRPVTLRLRSKDVIHNFYMPNMRVKQDALPGLEIPLRFQATETGDYDVLCAELCGLGHYRMQARLLVREQPEFEAWLREQAEE